MVHLDFQRDAAELRDLNIDPMNADRGDLEIILLRQAITLVIGDSVVLDRILIPLFFMATIGQRVVADLPKRQRAALDIPEGSLKLTFAMSGDEVTVREEYYSKEGRAPHEELVEAWQRFSSEAREFLLREFPDLVKHPGVGAWFRGEVAGD